MPGHLQEHLVVVDVKDRSLFIGDARQDEWQDFAVRIFLPLAEINVFGNTVQCSPNDGSGPTVDVHFNFKADADALIAAIEKSYGDEQQTRIVQGLQAANLRSAKPFPRPSRATLLDDQEGIRHRRPSASSQHLSPPSKVEAQLGYAQRTSSATTQLSAEIKSKGIVGASKTAKSIDPEPTKNWLLLAIDKKLQEKPDPTQLAAHTIGSTTVGQMCKHDPNALPIVDRQTPLKMVQAQFEEASFLMYLDENGCENIISKSDFISRLLVTSTGKKTFDDWMHESLPDHQLDTFPNLAVVHHNRTLGHAMKMMLESGAREVCVKDDKQNIVGIVTYDQIIELASDEFAQERTVTERKSAGANTHKVPSRFGTTFDPFEGWGPLRTSTALWVTSAVTETAIISLTFVDIGASAIDLLIFNPCVSCADEYTTIKEYNGKSYSFATVDQCMSALKLFDCDYAATLEHPLNAFTGAILMIFVLESLSRVYAFRLDMFKSVLDCFDFIIVYVSAAAFIWMVAAQGSKLVRQLVTVGRAMRFLRLIRMVNKLRRALLVNKMRYRKDGFNLDLTYVNDRLIAMPLPAEGMEAKTYNDIEDVSRFFRKMHFSPNGASFLIFNVCSERTYKHRLFLGQVVDLLIEGDNPPTLEQLVKFVERVDQWQDLSPDNVVAVHDIAGLARTGIFVVCWLVYSGFAQHSSQQTVVQDALAWFCLRRLGREQDEAMEYTPSQKRYMEYFREVVDQGGYELPALTLDSIVMYTTPKLKSSGRCSPWFIIRQGQKEVFDYSKYHKVSMLPKGRDETVFDCGGCQLRGDLTITFYDNDIQEMTDEEMFCISLHTGFLPTDHLVVPLHEIDGACRDTKNSVYEKNFQVELVFAKTDATPRGEKSRKSKPVQKALSPPSESVKDDAITSSARLRNELKTKSGTSLAKFSNVHPAAPALLALRRFQEEGFDLDLTYITNRLIAIGAGSSSQDDLCRFLTLKHPNKCLIYDLVADTPNAGVFDADLVNTEFVFAEDRPPPMDRLVAFCHHVQEYLSKNAKHVVAVRCNSGKDRTGCLISCYMLFSHVFTDAIQAIEFFSAQRTRHGKGITALSQRKYVQYFDVYVRYLQLGVQPPISDSAVLVTLQKMTVSGLAEIYPVQEPQIVITYAIPHKVGEDSPVRSASLGPESVSCTAVFSAATSRQFSGR